jgi:hypothetical protein
MEVNLMVWKPKFVLFAAVIIGIVLVWRGHVSSDNIFIASPAHNPGIAEPESEGLLKQEFIQLDTDVLQEVRFRQQRARLDALDEGMIEIQIDRRKVVDDKTSVLHGHVYGQPESQVILSIAGESRKNSEVMVGTIALDSGRVFRIDYLGENIHRLGEVNPAFGQYCCQGIPEFGQTRGPDGRAVQWAYQYVRTSSGEAKDNPGHSVASGRGLHRQSGGNSGRLSIRVPSQLFAERETATQRQPAGILNSAQSNSVVKTAKPRIPSSKKPVIDVLVMYTPQAAKKRGGETGVRALAGLAVDTVNQAFKSSDIQAKMRLVGVEEWSYTLDARLPLVEGLHALRDDSKVVELRNKLNADLVAGFVGTSAGGAAGVAYLMKNPKGQGKYGYSLSAAAYIGGPHYTFTHEIGHNLGCIHAKDQSGRGVFPYSYGWRFSGRNGKKYCTVMSYRRYSDELRLPVYSNPRIPYKGTPTGTTEADNARTISQTAKVVAKYR